MDGNPTLKQFLSTQESLGCERDGTDSFIRWRQIFWEHLLNRHRAVAEDLTPLRIFEYGAKLQGHLDTRPLTNSQLIAVHQLCDALLAGDESWQRLVLERLGLDLNPEALITSFHRSVLVFVFRHGRPPVKEPWYRPERNTVGTLSEWGYIGTSGDRLQLTDDGLAASGVLWPRMRYNDEGSFYYTGAEAYAVLIGPMREHRQAIVRLLEVERR